MLDIYFAPPSTEFVPADPGSLELAGSLDLDTHRSLAVWFERGRQAGADLQYFRDSLLNPAQVRILLQIFMTNAPEVEASEPFAAVRQLLERAVNQGVALVTFSD